LRVSHPSFVFFELAVYIAVAPISFVEVNANVALDTFVNFEHHFTLKVSVLFQTTELLMIYMISRSFGGKYLYPI
jgi:hypothetical protein